MFILIFMQFLTIYFFLLVGCNNLLFGRGGGGEGLEAKSENLQSGKVAYFAFHAIYNTLLTAKNCYWAGYKKWGDSENLTILKLCDQM